MAVAPSIPSSPITETEALLPFHITGGEDGWHFYLVSQILINRTKVNISRPCQQSVKEEFSNFKFLNDLFYPELSF